LFNSPIHVAESDSCGDLPLYFPGGEPFVGSALSIVCSRYLWLTRSPNCAAVDASRRQVPFFFGKKERSQRKLPDYVGVRMREDVVRY
jgi:hypothetical protein